MRRDVHDIGDAVIHQDGDGPGLLPEQDKQRLDEADADSPIKAKRCQFLHISMLVLMNTDATIPDLQHVLGIQNIDRWGGLKS